MNTAPAGRLGRKQYHSWTSGLIADEYAKLPSFLAGRSWKHWMATGSCECPYPHRHTHRLTHIVPGEKEGMEWNEASCCTQAHHLLFRSWPQKEVTEWSRPWVFEEGEGKNHCQVSVVEFLANIWLIYHWKQKPPSGTTAAVSNFPALEDNGNICSSKRDICTKALGEKDS